MDKSDIIVAFLNVGQGDSTIVILPDRSSALVVDCFNDSVVSDYLEKNGIRVLRYVILTHTDDDHIGGIVGLLENFGDVEGIAYHHDTPRISKGKRRVILRHLVELSRQRGLNFQCPFAGWSWLFQGVTVDVLHPAELDKLQAELSGNGDTNNASIMLRITFAGQRILLTGDVQGQAWQWIIERNTDLQADVFKFPHHGGWYTPKNKQPSLEEILQRVSPKLVIISVGTHNPYEHPGTETFELLLSHPQLRFFCTQATSRCHSSLTQQRQMQPCAGTVEVIVNDIEGIKVVPDSVMHEQTINMFDQPKCKHPTQ